MSMGPSWRENLWRSIASSTNCIFNDLSDQAETSKSLVESLCCCCCLQYSICNNFDLSMIALLHIIEKREKWLSKYGKTLISNRKDEMYKIVKIAKEGIMWLSLISLIFQSIKNHSIFILIIQTKVGVCTVCSVIPYSY